MNKFIFFSTILVITWLSGVFSPVLAMYDPLSVPNNKVGVHILHPSEIEQAAQFINNQGGDWGYVTVPIQPTDRDKDKWLQFMVQAKNLHLIPIIRITTIPLGGTWNQASDTDLVDFANFLHELPWPVENRYIVLFNEVNRDQEWGGKVDPVTYTQIVKNARTIFKERSQDFFLLGPALDSALPDSVTSLSAGVYLRAMESADAAIWSYFDGWASHSYPNPGFTASPSKTGWQSIVSYRTETGTLRISAKPVFITETGWDQRALAASVVESYWRQAFNIWNLDPTVAAVTPFVLAGGEVYVGFSLIDFTGNPTPTGRSLASLPKTVGNPKLAGSPAVAASPGNLSHTTGSDATQRYRPLPFVLKIENFFRSLIGLHEKSFVRVGSANLTVEISQEKNEWEKGLSGRDSLSQGTGMLFRFPREHLPVFWMKDMKFPIDIVWIKNGTILSIEQDVPPPQDTELPTFSPPQPVDTVLEVPAGFAAESGWEPGTPINYYY